MTRRYLIASDWGDTAEADSYEGALAAKRALAADHRPHCPTDDRGVTITIYAAPDELTEGVNADNPPFEVS